MRNLKDMINEVMGPTKKISEVFDIDKKFTVLFTSHDIDSDIIMNKLNDYCEWDDKIITIVERYGGSQTEKSKFKKGSRELRGTMKQIGEEGISKSSVIVNILRLIGRIEVKNTNSIRSITSAIRKELSAVSNSDGKKLYIWTSSDDENKIYYTFQENFGKGDRMDLFHFTLTRK